MKVPDKALQESMAIVGRTGSGKTYAAKTMLEQLLVDGAHACIIDPTGVWWGLRATPSGQPSKIRIPVFGGDHADVPLEPDLAKAIAEFVADGNNAILDVSEFGSKSRIRFMTVFLEELYRLNRRPMHLVVDEADMFAPQRAMPDETVLLNRMEQIVRRGRVRGFTPWLITQRPAVLSKNVMTQVAALIAMQLTAPQDRDAIGAWIEGQADRDQGKRVLADLPKLKKGEGWIWSPSHDVLERVQFPAIQTFDSSRTPEDGEALAPVKLAEVDLSEIRTAFAVARKKEADEIEAMRAVLATLQSIEEGQRLI